MREDLKKIIEDNWEDIKELIIEKAEVIEKVIDEIGEDKLKKYWFKVEE